MSGRWWLYELNPQAAQLWHASRNHAYRTSKPWVIDHPYRLVWRDGLVTVGDCIKWCSSPTQSVSKMDAMLKANLRCPPFKFGEVVPRGGELHYFWEVRRQEYFRGRHEARGRWLDVGIFAGWSGLDLQEGANAFAIVQDRDITQWKAG